MDGKITWQCNTAGRGCIGTCIKTPTVYAQPDNLSCLCRPPEPQTPDGGTPDGGTGDGG